MVEDDEQDGTRDKTMEEADDGVLVVTADGDPGDDDDVVDGDVDWDYSG